MRGCFTAEFWQKSAKLDGENEIYINNGRFVISTMDSSRDEIELLRRIADDLHAVRGHARRLAKRIYLDELNQVASTPQRREMWRLCDGATSTHDLANRVGVSLRTVQYFVEDAERLELLASPRRGYPKRADDFDEIPVDWKPYKRVEPIQSAQPEVPSGSNAHPKNDSAGIKME